MIRSVSILLALLTLPSPSLANEKKPLVWGYINFEPFHYSVNNKMTGTVVSKMDKIFDSAGLTYTSYQLPNKRAQLFTQEGKVDFSLVIESFLLEPEKFLKSTAPVFEIVLGAVCLSKVQAIENINDLARVRLVLISSYSYGNLLPDRDSLDVSIYSDAHEGAVKALVHRRGDCALGYQSPFQIEQNKYPDIRFKFYPLTVFPVHLFLNKQVPDATAIMDKINKYNQ